MTIKILDESTCTEIRTRVLANCRDRTGYADACDPQNGCTWPARGPTSGFRLDADGGFHVQDAKGPLRCACIKDRFSAARCLAEAGFSWRLLADHFLADIEVVDRAALDAFVVDPRRVYADGRALYVWGRQIGQGKTTLATLVAAQLWTWKRDNRSGGYPGACFMQMLDFCERAWVGREGFVEDLDEGIEFGRRKVDLWAVAGPLVIDEVGREASSTAKAAAGRSMLEMMLRDRQRQPAPTILCGSLEPADIAARLGEQVDSLLSEMATFVEVVGPDRRRKNQ